MDIKTILVITLVIDAVLSLNQSCFIVERIFVNENGLTQYIRTHNAGFICTIYILIGIVFLICALFLTTVYRVFFEFTNVAAIMLLALFFFHAKQALP